MNPFRLCISLLFLLAAFTQGRLMLMEMAMESSKIGSRPPRCDRLCIACGHCEAVQVPATPQRADSPMGFFFRSVNGGREDTSNYKPVNWKCKCGNFIFNP